MNIHKYKYLLVSVFILLGIFLIPNKIFAAVVLKQSSSTYLVNSQTGVSVSAGDLIIVGYSYNSTLQTVSCSDNAAGGTNTYSQVGTGQDGSGEAIAGGHIFYAVAKAAEVLTVTCTNETDPGISTHVLSGMNQTLSSVLDVSSSSVDSVASTTHQTRTITTANANDYLFVYWFQETGEASITENGTSFTKRTEQLTHTHATFDRTVASTGSYFNKITSGSSLRYGHLIAAFKINNSPSSLGPTSLVNGSWSTSTQPLLSFSQTDPNASNTVKYTIQISTSSSFTSQTVDYTSALISQGSTSFTVGQAAGGGSYTIGTSSQTLPDGQYYWRVMSTNNNNATSSYTTANSGAIAFGVDTTAPSGTIASSTYGTITSSSIIINRPSTSTITESGSGLYQWQVRRNSTTTLSAVSTSTATTSDSSLTSNTQYTYDVRFIDLAGNTSSYGATSSKYTLTPDPTGFATSSVSTSSITLSVTAINNPTSDSSGYNFTNTTNSSSSGWITTNSWANTNLICGTSYSYTVQYRNGDGTTSATSSLTQTTSNCSAPDNPSSLGPTSLVNGSWSTSTQPLLSFTQSDSVASNIVKYTIQVSTSSSFTSQTIDYISALLSQTSTSFTVGQAVGGGTYTVGTSSQTLPDGQYYWRVMSTNNNNVTSSYATANGGAVAFGVDTTAPFGAIASSTYGTITTSSIIINRPATSTITESGSGLYQWQVRRNSSTTLSAVSTSTATTTDSSLTSNTQYTYDVGFIDLAGNISSYGATSSKYTLTPAPTNLAATPSQTSNALSVDSFNNASSGQSGYYFRNIVASTTSGWITSNSWTDTSLTCNTSYSYEVKYRNGDATESATSSLSQTTSACAVSSAISGAGLPISILSSKERSLAPLRMTGEGDKTTKTAQGVIQSLSKLEINSAKNLFTNYLYPGLKNLDVKNLQSLLSNYPDIYPEAKITGYYGQLTRQAVQKLQIKYNITTSSDKAYGLVGPSTRKVLNLLGQINYLQNQLNQFLSQLKLKKSSQ